MDSRYSASMATVLQKRLETTNLSGIDRLSDLPDSMICHILSFLPTKNVVATSVISTRWKYPWKKVASLEFRFKDMMYKLDDGQNFDQIVSKVLLVGDGGRLDKFSLQWDLGSKKEADYVDIWVNHVISRSLGSLDLESGNKSFEVNIPETLFMTCKTLEFLKLAGGFSLRFPNVVCLPKLQVLHLDIFGNISNESIHKLVAGCPALHTLALIFSYNRYNDTDLKIWSPSLRYLLYDSSKGAKKEVYDRKLEIDAPNLECLTLHDSSSDCFIKGPIDSVDIVSLRFGVNCLANSLNGIANRAALKNRMNSTVKLVETLKRAKRLSLMGGVTMAIGLAPVPLSTRFERLTRLDIVCPWCFWRHLHQILGCCIRLQFLSMSDYNSELKDSWKDPKKVLECLSSSLAQVSLKTYNVLEGEMSMVRYFLKHGSVLESFNVTAHSSMSDSDKLQMLQAISKFLRLSTTCSISLYTNQISIKLGGSRIT